MSVAIKGAGPGSKGQGAHGTDSIADELRDATSHDLVFAVVGHLGAGASRISQALVDALDGLHHKAHAIEMSKLIQESAQKNGFNGSEDMNADERLERTRALQRAGNWLRTEYGPAFTAGLAIRKMHEQRPAHRTNARPMVFIIDSLKNPAEVDALRKVYGNAFYLVSVVCGRDKRQQRLELKYQKSAKSKKVRKQELEELMKVDEAEEERAGQQVRKTVQHGDFFVNNEADIGNEADVLDKELERFLQAVFGTKVIRPNQDECGMYAAWNAALRSSCLSRQVGAAILDTRGQLIATGTNDVPRFGGGLYQDGDHENDHRCFVGQGYCRNDRTKTEILTEIARGLADAKLLREGTSETHVIQAIGNTPIRDLIEFSRAVHAEMDALVSLGRTGGGSTIGASIYCTTYPCHNCARHIVAAGIREVVYIEPYVKSRAIRLHDDAIVEATRAPEDNATKVHFRLFTGVAPRRYASLFEKRGEIKVDGRLHLPQATDTRHGDPIFTKSYIDFESVIAQKVSNQEVPHSRAQEERP